ncbi:MAG: helix-turn-helix transcriptional regulator [Rhodothermales bacterium]|nr:helix-turn-helix transcriptional regulator [Rhodothermales bacterium]
MYGGSHLAGIGLPVRPPADEVLPPPAAPVLHLSDSHALERAQRALLSPFAQADADAADGAAAWMSAVTAATRALVAADHSALFLPDPQGRGVTVFTEDTDPAVPAAYDAFFLGLESGVTKWDDPLLNAASRVRARSGPGVYHERDLTPRATVEASSFYQERLAPHGIRYTMGLSVPVPDRGDFSVMVAYERPDAHFHRDEEGPLRLRLLLPAFEAAVRARLRLAERLGALTRTVDELRLPALIVGADGQELHRTPALDRLTQAEPRPERLLQPMQAWARLLVRNAAAPPALPPTRLQTPRARYRLYGARLPADVLGPSAAVVIAEPAAPALPAATTARARFGLTAREAEVAHLLARGLTDAEVAEQLGVSWHTARKHAERVLQKLGVSSRAAVALTLLDDGA